MPTYGYRCANGHEFDVVQSMLDKPVAECPECHEHATRLIYPVGIVFKGGGFYKTDSRQTSNASGDTKTSDEGKGSAASPATKGDANPSPKPAPTDPSPPAASPSKPSAPTEPQ